MNKESLVSEEILESVGNWRNYVEAKLGFKNHWYPVVFSKEVEEGKPVAVQVLGEKILLNRIEGKVYAIRNRCMHGGVRFDAKIECHTRDTITCWYHGFTYDWKTGKLTDVIAAPNTKIVDGRRGIKTFPVEEAKGLVFVFVGDSDFEVPHLSTDVPPGFLDDDRYVLGIRRNVASNWRHGVENGFDTTHIYIHRNAELIGHQNLLLPLGFVPSDDRAWEVHDDPSQPRGIEETYGPHNIPAFHGSIKGERVLEKDANPEGKNILPRQINMWLPCVLEITPWPDPATTQYEWYVPVDESDHMYIQTLSTKVSTEEEKTKFDYDFNNRWVDQALMGGFNDDDIWAREAAEEAYKDDNFWIDEALFEPDKSIIAFRELISKHGRGIQRPDDIRF